MVLPYLALISVLGPRPDAPNANLFLFAILSSSLIFAAVFVISQMHGLNFLTRMMKIVIMILLMSLTILLDLCIDPIVRTADGFTMVLFVATSYYYIVLIVIMVVLMLCKHIIGTIIKKENDDFYFHKKK